MQEISKDGCVHFPNAKDMKTILLKFPTPSYQLFE